MTTEEQLLTEIRRLRRQIQSDDAGLKELQKYLRDTPPEDVLLSDIKQKVLDIRQKELSN